MRGGKFEVCCARSSCCAEPTFGRTLPVRVAPMPGEALDSWLEAIAFRYRVAMGDVMSWCGIAPTPQTTSGCCRPRVTNYVGLARCVASVATTSGQ
jgi:hypothetical protein